MVCSEAKTTGASWAQHSQQRTVHRREERRRRRRRRRLHGWQEAALEVVSAPGFSVQCLPLSSCTLCKYFVYCWCDSIEAWKPVGTEGCGTLPRETEAVEEKTLPKECSTELPVFVWRFLYLWVTAWLSKCILLRKLFLIPASYFYTCEVTWEDPASRWSAWELQNANPLVIGFNKWLLCVLVNLFSAITKKSAISWSEGHLESFQLVKC